MAASTSYIVFLRPPLSTPGQIQELGSPPPLPEVRPVNEGDPDDEEREDGGTQSARPTSCCVVDRSIKDAIMNWSRSSGNAIMPMIPILPTESADTTQAIRSGYPVPYFLHSALTPPALIQGILSLEQLPTLDFATVSGYQIRRRARDTVLTSCHDRAIMGGQVYMVPSEEVVEMLADHFGFAFEAVPCEIALGSVEKVKGNLFRYRGDRLGLEDLIYDFE